MERELSRRRDPVKRREARSAFRSNGRGGIYACFALIGGEDPTYGYIEGEWRSSSPYGTIHRIASSRRKRGVFAECTAFARTRYDYLRVDTHADNLPMQGAVQKEGFSFAGIIYLADGSPRRAYEWIRE